MRLDAGGLGSPALPFSVGPPGLERITLFMIVKKFGGSSVKSGDAILRLARTVKSHLDRQPVVVVSAMGKTTNKLLEFAEHARRGDRSRQAAVHIDRALGWVSFSQSIRSRRTHAPIG